MVIAVVGDVKAAQTMPLVEKYFGRVPAAPAPEPLRTEEPPQKGPAPVILHEQTQPALHRGLPPPRLPRPRRRGLRRSRDLLSNGRTSRLYRALVRDTQDCHLRRRGSFPGTKYPNLFFFFALPAEGHAGQELAAPIHEEIEKLKSQDVTDEELHVKIRARADLLRGLGDNQGLAFQLGRVPGPLRRLARALPPDRAHRESHQGRYPPRGQGDLRGRQPHGGHDRNRQGRQAPPKDRSKEER